MDVAFEMVHGDQRFFESEGQGLRVTDADQQGSGQAGALGYGDGVHGIVGVFCVRKCLANHRHDGAQMLAGGQLGNHTAVGLVGRDLGGDHVGDELLARAYDGGGSFVAGTFDAEDVGVGHVSMLLEILITDLMQHVRKLGFTFSERIIHLFVGGSEMHGAKCARD